MQLLLTVTLNTVYEFLDKQFTRKKQRVKKIMQMDGQEDRSEQCMVGYYYAYLTMAITNAVVICHRNRLKTKNMLELKVNKNIFLCMFSQGGELCFTAFLQHRPAGSSRLPAARSASCVSNDVHKRPSGGGSPHLQPEHKTSA